MSARRWLVALVAVGIIQTLLSLREETVDFLANRASPSSARAVGLSISEENSAHPSEIVEGGVSRLSTVFERVGARGADDPAPALRIISLAPSVTEILFALGAGGEVVGVSRYCDYPPEAATITRVGSFLTPNVEVIVALRPDLIIGVPTPGNEGPVKSLQSLGLKIVIVEGDTMRQMRESIDLIARAIGRPADGRRLLEQIDGRMAAVHDRVRDAPVRRVLMVVGQKPLVAVGTNTFQDELIRMAGGINVAGGTGLAWPHLNIETVIAWAPEVIIDATMGTEESARALDFWKQFPSLPAVRDQHLYGYRSYQLLRAGPRIADALDTVARAIHPERF